MLYMKGLSENSEALRANEDACVVKCSEYPEVGRGFSPEAQPLGWI